MKVLLTTLVDVDAAGLSGLRALGASLPGRVLSYSSTIADVAALTEEDWRALGIAHADHIRKGAAGGGEV